MQKVKISKKYYNYKKLTVLSIKNLLKKMNLIN